MCTSSFLKRVLASGRSRGVTLIEAVLYISIALALIIGGLVFYQQASLAARVSQQIRVVSSIVSESRAMFTDPSSLVSLPSITVSSVEQMALMTGARLDTILISAGSIAPDVILNPPRGSGPFTIYLENEWGGGIYVVGGRTPDNQLSLVIALGSIPRAACTRLAWSGPDGQGAVSDGIRAVGFSTAAGGSFFGLPQNDLSLSALSAPEKCGAAENVNVFYTIALK